MEITPQMVALIAALGVGTVAGAVIAFIGNFYIAKTTHRQATQLAADERANSVVLLEKGHANALDLANETRKADLYRSKLVDRRALFKRVFSQLGMIQKATRDHAGQLIYVAQIEITGQRKPLPSELEGLVKFRDAEADAMAISWSIDADLSLEGTDMAAFHAYIDTLNTLHFRMIRLTNSLMQTNVDSIMDIGPAVEKTYEAARKDVLAQFQAIGDGNDEAITKTNP